MTQEIANPEEWQKIENVGGKDPKGILCEVFYSAGRHVFKVDVSAPAIPPATQSEKTLSEEFAATYRPIFGIDIDDFNTAMEIGERLAQTIETELNLK